MSRSPNLRARDWLVFSPFSHEVWIGTILSLTTTAAVLYLSLKLKWKNIVKPPSGIAISLYLFAVYMGQSEWKCSYLHINLVIYHLFCITATTFQWKKSFQVRVLITVWILAVLILSNSYSGCFYSILAIPEFELPIDTVADIQKVSQFDRGYIITLADSSYLQMFITSVKEGGIFYLIGQHMNRYKVKRNNDKVDTFFNF